MRRLAKQDREDQYASRRDYQQVEETASPRLQAEGAIDLISLAADIQPGSLEAVGGFGAFIQTPESTEVTLRVSLGTTAWERQFHAGPTWSRIGLGFLLNEPARVEVQLKFATPQGYVDLWGATIRPAHLPKGLFKGPVEIERLNTSHLLPETLYLDHNSADASLVVSPKYGDQPGSVIQLKKCSYCGRSLPVGPGQPGRLSFHKHNAKISGHQNECRACKKWRINDSFNPLRTVDQLNESSLITRERRLLLEEPAILQSIKDREGRGLKSIVWERFGRKCFYCDKALKLKEVELDHTRPLAYLWPIDEHATSLCSEHNNHKKDKFPVDFYTPDQLARLSEITGLSLSKLQKRSICEPQLKRIRRDVAGFAAKCDPRAFNAIARKVREMHDEIDLWKELEAADPDVYALVRSGANARPASVPDSREAKLDELLQALED